MILRNHVSKKAARRVRAVLEAVCLDTPTIEMCFINNPMDIEAAVQAGLIEWVEGKGHQPPTWEALLKTMDNAEIAQQDIQALKTALGL